MATVGGKLKFLCLHLFCIAIDFIPRVVNLIRGRGRGHFKVYGTQQAIDLFGLAAIDGRPYPDPPYNGHVGTILCAFRPPQPVPYTRVVTPGGDGNPMCVDWYLCTGPAKAVIVIFPGLASWSGTNYIEHFVHHAHAEGMHCAVFNARGLGDTPLTQPRLMSAVWTEDIRGAVRSGPLSRKAIAARCGAADPAALPVVGVGFSLGGIILSKFAGEECRDGRPPFDAAVTVNSPLDTVASNDLMMTPFCKAVYQPSMVGGLLRQTRLHAEVLGGIPGLDPTVHEAFATGRAETIFKKIHTIEDYDRYITCPANGFATPHEYYRAISPLRWIAELTIPVLCVSAEDDPVCGEPPVSELREIMLKQGNLGVVTAPHGGHLGYVRGPMNEWRGESIVMETLVCEAIANFAKTTKAIKSHEPQ